MVDPLKRDVHDFEIDKEQDSEQDIVFQPQLEHCKSSHHSIWMGRFKYLSIKRNLLDNLLITWRSTHIYIYN